MHIKELDHKRVCILGFGKEGQATLRAINRFVRPAEIIIADANPGPAGYRLPFHRYTCAYGPGYLDAIPACDVIIKSPGIHPREMEELHEKIPTKNYTLTNSTQIFLDTIASSGATVIGVTGSKGKSTTSSLIYEVLKAAGKNVYLIGNIGNPSLDHITDARANTFFVQEMSSYQLMDLTTSPEIAVVTSFFPEHLDYHASTGLSTSLPLENYKEAKKHIARFQKSTDTVFYNASSDGAREIAMESSGKRIPFSSDECPIPIEETHLIGEHNQSNIAAAFKIAVHLGISEKTAIEVIRKFKGLPHRLQSLGVHHGIEWIDDAISTTPESAIAALDALGDRVVTIILGGQDRGNNFGELGKRIATSKIQNVILFPESGKRIRAAIEEALSSETPPPRPPSPPVGQRGGGDMYNGMTSRERGLRTARSSRMTSARLMRKYPTEPEALLWQYLRNHQFHNLHFRRQHPIGKYVLDFFCGEANIAVELDGSQHDELNMREYDNERTEYLKAAGMTVIRFKNREVLQNVDGVLEKIVEHILSPLHAKHGEGLGVGSLRPRTITFFETMTMQDAVKFAISHSKAGFICLLSPASPSYGMFKNFEEKGDAFTQAIIAK